MARVRRRGNVIAIDCACSKGTASATAAPVSSIRLSVMPWPPSVTSQVVSLFVWIFILVSVLGISAVRRRRKLTIRRRRRRNDIYH
jgi:hypothetical protein